MAGNSPRPALLGGPQHPAAERPKTIDVTNLVLVMVVIVCGVFVVGNISTSVGVLDILDPTEAESRPIFRDSELQTMWRNDYNARQRERRLGESLISGGSGSSLTSQQAEPHRCAGLAPNELMDRMLGRYKQVYFLMPALAAGSTVKHFVSKCMLGKRSFADAEDNVLNKWHDGKDLSLREALTDSLEVQTVLVSHAYSDQTLIDLMKQTTRNSLIIYVHREETDRVKASVRHIVERLCPALPEQCKLKEADVVEALGQKGTEMEMGMSQLLTCDAYQAVEDNRPNLVFLNMRRIDKLFPLVTKHHCEHREAFETLAMNTARQHRLIYVELNRGIDKGMAGDAAIGEGGGGGTEYFIDLAEWIEHKGEMLEYVMDYKKDVTCQATTRYLEDELFDCPDETLLVSGGRRL